MSLSLRSQRLYNALIAGQFNSTTLQTELGNSVQLGAFRQILLSPYSYHAVALVQNASSNSAVCGSALAWTEIVAARNGFVFDSIYAAVGSTNRALMDATYGNTTAIARLMPTAWAVWAPHTSRITAVSNAVSAWADATANGRNLTQGTAGFRPAYLSTLRNGYIVPVFDASDDVLGSSATQSLSGDATFYIVRARTTTSTNSDIIRGATTGYIIRQTNAAAINTNDTGAGGAYVVPGSISGTANTWELVRVRRSSGATFLRVNGAAEGSSVATPGNAYLNAETLQLGTSNSAVAEVVILNRSAADGDIEGDRIVTLLRNKYSLW
jgi:hypothetical protein